MTDELRINERVSLPARELRWRFARSGGPGGQGVNTADSKAELAFDLLQSPSLPDFLKERATARLGNTLVNGTITVVSSEHRSQLQNRKAAEQRLAALLADVLAPPAPKRRATRPSVSAKRKRVDVKKQRGEIKRNRRPPEV